MTTKPAPSIDTASLEHIARIEDKIAVLRQAAEESARQVVEQMKRERALWCACRIRDAVSSFVTARNVIANELDYWGYGDLVDEARQCVCEDRWMSGEFPVTDKLPTIPGVYICFDEEGRAAYIGTSRANVKQRLQVHFRDPEKPRLLRWSAFFPGKFNESAAIWEVRLIEEHKPYCNRLHVNSDEPTVSWEPQGERAVDPPVPWFERDKTYRWFRAGPGRMVNLSASEPWKIAKALRNLVDRDGVTLEEIEEACEIASCQEGAKNGVAYMCGVARNLATARLEQVG